MTTENCARVDVSPEKRINSTEKVCNKEKRLAVQLCAPLSISKRTNEIYCNRQHIILKCFLSCFMYLISCEFRLLLKHTHSLTANHDKDVTTAEISK